MAQQIKKKFIQDNAVDGEKIKLLKDQSIRGENQSGVEVDLLKLNASDKALILGQEIGYKADLDNEISARIAGDSSTLQGAKDYADQKVADLVNSAPAVLDTLKELADALGGDANFATTISNQIGSVDSKVDQEILDRQAADSSLSTDILDEKNRAEAAEDALDGKLDQEIFDRSEADTLINQALANEVSARQSADSALDVRLSTLEAFGYDQILYVSKNGSDTNSGKQHKPFLTITAAMNAISDASPSKRYAVAVYPGGYSEAIALKANVFVIGIGQKEAIRITGAVSMGSSFTANSSFDNRSGFANLSLLSAADFNWNTVQSAAGKLYFNGVVFGSTVNMYGYNNAIAQAQFNACIIFGAFTVSGINIGVFTNNVCFSSITLNQHPNGGMATILSATGGYCGGNISLVTTVNDFNRRCSAFLRNFWSENLIVNGPSCYADVDLVSGSKQGAQTSNGGQVVALNPIISHDLTTQMIVPRNTNSHNMGDWGKQWNWNFGYVHASTGTDLYLISYPESYAPDSSGKSIGIYTDGAGLQANVNGGDIVLETATTSGTGIRGKIQLNGKEIDVTSKQIKNLANGSDATDAVNKQQLDEVQSGLQSQIDAVDSRIDVLEAIPQISFNKETKLVSSSMITDGYVDLAFEAKDKSIVLFVDRLGLHEGYDYSVSVVGGVSRITFSATLLAPSEIALEIGDILNVTYAK